MLVQSRCEDSSAGPSPALVQRPRPSETQAPTSLTSICITCHFKNVA